MCHCFEICNIFVFVSIFEGDSPLYFATVLKIWMTFCLISPLFQKFWFENNIPFRRWYEGDLRGWNDIAFRRHNKGKKRICFVKSHHLWFNVVLPLIKTLLQNFDIGTKVTWDRETRVTCKITFQPETSVFLWFMYTFCKISTSEQRWFETVKRSCKLKVKQGTCKV